MLKNRGFTLIEVLVATALVGIALPALLFRVQSVLDNTAYVEDKTYAFWLAQNKLNELILQQEIDRSATKTKKDGDTVEFAERDWLWRVEVLETPVPKMYRITVEVGLEQDETLAALSGFLYE